MGLSFQLFSQALAVRPSLVSSAAPVFFFASSFQPLTLPLAERPSLADSATQTEPDALPVLKIVENIPSVLFKKFLVRE